VTTKPVTANLMSRPEVPLFWGGRYGPIFDTRFTVLPSVEFNLVTLLPTTMRSVNNSQSTQAGHEQGSTDDYAHKPDNAPAEQTSI